VARKWLAECLEKHDKCKRSKNSQMQRKGPSRLVNVGTSDGSQDPRLEEGPDPNSEYTTLSYCWGDPSSVTKTTAETLLQFREHIPVTSLNRIFRDAIEFTRSLGVKYIWIDSLCIIQDSPEDKTAELPRMSEIYEGSVLTISASMATSGGSALFTDRQWFNLVKVPRSYSDEGSLYITNQVLHNFTDDVLNGTLGNRGWCFQERLLSTRLLHFGREQFHWECHEGIWSECSTRRRWYDDYTSPDDGELRETLQSNTIISKPVALVERGPVEEGGNEVIDAAWNKFISEPSPGSPPRSSSVMRKMYEDWYSTVSAYTYRKLTNSSDKLPALAGAAVRFNGFIKDAYVAGLWLEDLPDGLLWSRSTFKAVKVDPAIARRPGVGGWGEMSGDSSKSWRGAPSWSWASVDGPVHWVERRNGPLVLGAFMLMSKPGIDEGYQGFEWCALRVRGFLAESGKMSWIREEARNTETQSELEQWLATLPAAGRPTLDVDDPEWERTLESAGRSRPLYFLLVRAFPPVQTPDGGLQSHYLGYALMLRFWPGDGAFRRVGIAKVALSDFQDVAMQDIHIF
jgi:Heterokaryon incompatibility protein (HET)